jgi:transcriptional regulator with XRE-family HTH domain
VGPVQSVETIASRVRKLREALGFTQEGLADEAGAARTDVVKVETGKNQLSTYELRKKFARALCLPIETFSAYIDGEADFDGVLREAQRRRMSGIDESGAVRIGAVTDPSPERAAAVAFARANLLSEAAIHRVETMPPALLSPEDWYARIKVAELDLRAAGPDTPAAATRISHR